MPTLADRVASVFASDGPLSRAFGAFEPRPSQIEMARAVADTFDSGGIVLGGSGQGEQIAANKVPGARAALCNDLFTARLSREHNDANVLSMGGRIVAFGLADEIVRLWLATAFQGGRHQQRLDQIRDFEKSLKSGV